MMGVSEIAKTLFEWIDVYGQWFCVNVVYAWEFVCLPLAACLLVVFYLRGTTKRPSGGNTKGLLPIVSRLVGGVWRIAFVLLLFTVVVYLLLYRMHWYSWIAYPVMVLAVCFVLSRAKWCRVTDGLLHPAGPLLFLRDHMHRVVSFALRELGPARRKILSYVKHPPDAVADPRADARQLQPKARWTWLKVTAIVVGLWMLWFFLSVPSDLLALLLVVTACIGVSGVAIVRIGNCEREFDRYIKSDPRMTLYLDALRRIRAKGAIETLLCSDRLTDRDLGAPGVNLWTMLFRISLLPGVPWVLRFLACREWMPTIDSAFVVQRVEHMRQEIWRRYASARFGRFEKETAGDPLDAHLRRIEEWATRPHPPEPADDPERDSRWKPSQESPPEFDNRQLRQLRITWLALTEALAECHVFGAGSKDSEEQRRRDLLKAAELLGQAGETQHQLIRDQALFEGDHEPSLSLKSEATLAMHLLDLSARCLEKWLSGREQPYAKDLLLYGRYERFCGPVLDGRGFTGDLLEHVLRCVLLMRYRLIAHLRLLLSSEDVEAGSILSEENKDAGVGPSGDPQETGPAFETAMARLAYVGAFASLCIQRHKGNQARFPWLSDRQDRRVPPLTALGECIGNALSLARTCREPEYRVKNADRHIRRLAGMAIEQEIEHLGEGTAMWWELCWLAAGLYDSCGDSRIRRIWAMARTVDWQGPGAPSGEYSSRPDDIVEMS